MSVNANRKGVKKVHIKYKVVVVCDDLSEHTEVDIPKVNPFFTFDAIYRPPATALFKLSIVVNKTTIYLQLTPNRIKSLKKTTCDHRKKDPGICFEVISNHLGGRRSFTRLQFQLSRDADLIVPKGFSLDHCDAEAKCDFAKIASLATTRNFSLYMPREVLQNADYQGFFQAFQRWSNLPEDQDPELKRIADPRKLYQGSGGVLFRPVRPVHPVPLVCEAVAVGSLPENNQGSGASLPVCQQSTASESDATTATNAFPTPPGYEADGLPPSYEAHTHASRQSGPGNCRKHDLSSGEEDVDSNPLFKRKRSQISTADTWSHFHLSPTDPITAFKIQLRKYEEEIEQLKTNVATLQSQNKALEKRCSDIERRNEGLEEQYCDIESRQDSLEKTLDSVYANIEDEVEQGCTVVKDELRQESEGIVNDHLDLWTEENMGDVVEGYMEKYMEQYMNKYMEEKAAGFMADLRSKLRSVLSD